MILVPKDGTSIAYTATQNTIIQMERVDTLVLFQTDPNEEVWGSLYSEDNLNAQAGQTIHFKQQHKSQKDIKLATIGWV